MDTNITFPAKLAQPTQTNFCADADPDLNVFWGAHFPTVWASTSAICVDFLYSNLIDLSSILPDQ